MVNDYMLGAIDACNALTTTKTEFIMAIKKTTGLTDIGINNNVYIQELLCDKEVKTLSQQ